MLHAEKFNIDASLRELMPHGSASFPMEVEWADFRRMVGGMISWHWHEDLQFFLISEGEVEITVGRVRHHFKRRRRTICQQRTASHEPLFERRMAICLLLLRFFSNASKPFQWKYL